MNDFNLSVIVGLVDKISEPAKNINAVTNRLSKSLGKTQNTLSKLGVENQSVKAFIALKNSAKSTNKALKKSQDEVSLLAKKIKTTTGSTAKLNKEFTKAKTKAKQLKQVHANETVQLQKMRDGLKSIGISTKNLAQHQTNAAKKIAALNEKIVKQNRLLKITNKIINKSKTIGAKAANIGKIGTRIGVSLGVAAYGFKRIFVDTASEFERFKTILETVEGSSAAANKSMDWISDFATTTPYELAEVTDAFVKLRAYGLDPTNGLLRTLGDTSSAMGKSVIQAVEAVADAVTGENERLKEFGVKARVDGETITYEYTHKGETKTKAANKSNRKQIQDTLSAIFNEKYAGAMDKQSKTFEGLVSNLMDQWTRFKVMIMDAGVFDFLKKKLGGMLDKINKLAASGELKQYAALIAGKLLTGLKGAWEFGKGLYSALKSIGSVLSNVSKLLGGWNNLAIAMIALPMVGTITSIVTAFSSLAVVIVGLSAPVLGVIAAVAALGAVAYLIYDNWGGIKDYFSDMWGWVESKFNNGIANILSAVRKVTNIIPDRFLPDSMNADNLDKTIKKYREIGKLSLVQNSSTKPETMTKVLTKQSVLSSKKPTQTIHQTNTITLQANGVNDPVELTEQIGELMAKNNDAILDWQGI